MNSDTFIEIDHYRCSKQGLSVPGDIILTRKVDSNRVVSILCDGLGSGVEANVLASFTASMGIEYMVDNIDITRTAELIMDALPLCPLRKISYSTFSIADVGLDCEAHVIEHGNPSCMVFKSNHQKVHECKELYRERWNNRSLNYAHFRAEIGDRIILMSDGVTQSGLGSLQWPMGFGSERIRSYISDLIEAQPEISARDLSREIGELALCNDRNCAGDDITCMVIYIRRPRIMRILTGPPVDQRRDPEYANLLRDWRGDCAVCGGTTANIVERELHRTAVMNLETIDAVVPATSTMEGVNLVTEGCITLSCCARLLEEKSLIKVSNRNGAMLLRDLFLANDIIEFFVGTRINQAHQDPDLPIELDIRRNVIKKITSILKNDYLKETVIRYF